MKKEKRMVVSVAVAVMLLLTSVCVYANTNVGSAAGKHENTDVIYDCSGDKAYAEFLRCLEKGGERVVIKGMTEETFSRYYKSAKLYDYRFSYISLYRPYKKNGMIIMEMKKETYEMLQDKLAMSMRSLNGAYAKGSTKRKAKMLYDYLASSVEYKNIDDLKDSKTNPSDTPDADQRSLYAAVTGKGNCQALSKCYKYLCDIYDIPCRTVVSTDMKHMWNIIKVDGKWYNVDLTTADDEIPQFMVTSKEYLYYTGFMRLKGEIDTEICIKPGTITVSEFVSYLKERRTLWQ